MTVALAMAKLMNLANKRKAGKESVDEPDSTDSESSYSDEELDRQADAGGETFWQSALENNCKSECLMMKYCIPSHPS